LDAGRLFGDFLTTDAGARPFAATGWQVPSAADRVAQGTDGGTPPWQRLVPATPTVQAVTRALQSWSALEQRGSVLLVVDVSGSMDAVVPGTRTSRLQLARAALAESVVSFSDRSKLGLWAFSRRLDGTRDYRVVVPLGRSSDRVGGTTRREAVRKGALSLRAGGDTGLYDTTLAAVDALRGAARSGPASVVVLSDGRNDDPGSVALDELTRRLAAEQDPEHPVHVTTIAYSGQADEAALRKIAKASGGQAFTAASPRDLQQVLLTSLTALGG
jgi:Ca-activated chloride channel family protein